MNSLKDDAARAAQQASELLRTTLADRHLLQADRAMRTASDLFDSPSIRLAQELANGPAARLARELAESPSGRVLRDMVENPAWKMARDACERPAVSALASTLSEVGAIDHHAARMPFPVAPLNYQAQLVEEVVQLRGDVANLQQEVREVRESAAREATADRQHAEAQSNAEQRIKLWHVLLSCVISAVLTVLLTKWLDG